MHGRHGFNFDADGNTFEGNCCGQRRQKAQGFGVGRRNRKGACNFNMNNENALLALKSRLEQRLAEIKQRLDALKPNLSETEENKA